MSVQLLDKTRKINKLLHNNNSHKVVFNDICEVLSEILVSNVLVISKKGKVLGIKDRADIETINELINNEVGEYIDPLLNERLLGVLSTKENVNLETLGFEFSDISEYQAIITRLILPARDWELFLCTGKKNIMKLMTLFWWNTELQWSGWK